MAGRASIQEEEGPMVPVFTVIKNGAILKNIFVINNYALPLLEEEEEEEEEAEVRPFDLMDNVEGQEEVLIVGRHPDCDIMLTHPSISRFHLKILSNPTVRKLSVMDLSSVHGTWISDSRIDPGILVELKEGDTIRVGGSSRIYRLHWVPLSRAYDSENPFISALDLTVIREKEENEATEGAALVEAAQDDYDGVVESAQATETSNAYAVMEDEEICQNNDFSMANNSADLTLEDSIASSALHDLVKTENSLEFLTPVEGNLSVDQFQIDSEANLDNPVEDMSLWMHWEAPSSTNNQLYIDEQSMQSTLASESLWGCLSAATCEENANSFSGNQWTDSLGRLSPSLEALARTFSPATPSLIGNPQSGEPADIASLPVAETAKVGGNEQSLRRFSPSLEALARSLSSITPIENESLLSGKREDTQLPWTAFEPLLQKNCNRSAKRTSHPILSCSCPCEIEVSSNAADMFIIGGSQNQTGNQKGVLGDHIGDHSQTSKKKSSASNNVLAEVTHVVCHEENRNPESSSVKLRLFSDREKETSNLRSSAPKSNIWLRRGKPASVIQLQTGKARSKAKRATLDQHENEKQQHDRKENDTITWECSANSFEEEEIFTPDKENITLDTQLLRSLHKIGKKESEEEEGEEEIFTPDKENMTPNTRLLRSLNKIGKMKSEGEREEEEEEIFTPDKENMTPNTWLLKSLNKISKMKSREFIPSNSIKTRSSSKLSCLRNITTNGNILSLEKERKKPDVLRKQGTTDLQSANHPLSEITGTRTSARTPFQSLQASGHGRHASVSLHATGEKNSSIYEKGYTGNTFSDTSTDNIDGQRINWKMVVDTSSFLDKESRKSLQLLWGLKGTQLIIPLMVLRELECLKQRSSRLFRRAMDISSLLEWIEVCLVTTPWWIHIQTKPEEERSIAATPHASPCSAETSFWGNQCGVNSPTAEDHVLEYAISLARTQVGKHIILISNEVPLKIKAMAEGMICETAPEFQTSLVNPFSDRFMWRNSTARGRTWSGAHDEVLREIIYHRQSSKKKQSRGEGARGLKLILLHNSRYGKQISLN